MYDYQKLNSYNKRFIESIKSFFSFDSKPYDSMFHLKVGDKAPEFSSINENGEIVKLSDFRGKKLALFFYPQDNTPTCTTEACNLRDHYAELKAKGIEVLGVSPDSEKKHLNFIKKFSFPYSLLADKNLELMTAYGVWGKKTFMGKTFDGVHRTTFLIDENGIIQAIITKVEASNHARQILESLESAAIK